MKTLTWKFLLKYTLNIYNKKKVFAIQSYKIIFIRVNISLDFWIFWH